MRNRITVKMKWLGSRKVGKDEIRVKRLSSELETHFMPFKSPKSESDPSAPDFVPLPPGFIDVEQAKALLSQEEKDKLFSVDFS